MNEPRPRKEIGDAPGLGCPCVCVHRVGARACDWTMVVSCCLGVLLAAVGCGGQSTASTSTQRGPRPYALVLGDSFGTGYHMTAVPPAGDVTCLHPASMTTGSGGWVCVVVHSLRSFQPHLRFTNVATEGEDSCSVFTISSHCVALSPAQQHALTPQPGSQMARALTYLGRHSGQVSPIIFELGANDQILPGVPGLDTRAMEARIDRILARVRHAAPHADLIVLDYPHSPVPSPAFFRREASKYGGVFVDVHARFAHHPEYVDATDHPTDAGQRLVAQVLWQTYKRWIGKK